MPAKNHALIMIILMVVSPPVVFAKTASGIWRNQTVNYVSDEVAIFAENTSSNEEIERSLKAIGMKFDGGFDKFGHLLVKLPSDADAIEISLIINNMDGIKFAEPNIVGYMHSPFYPDDFYFANGGQWYLNSSLNGNDIDMPEAWAYGTGDSSVEIAVFDTDVNAGHTDLNANKIYEGWYFGDTIFGAHGTAVVGIINAMTNNDGIGIAGIAPNCEIKFYEIYSNTDMDHIGDPDYSELRASVFYTSCSSAVENGFDIIQMSGGFGYTNPMQAELAVQMADSAGVLMVFSAGNNGAGAEYPAAYSASYSNVVSVGSVNQLFELGTCYHGISNYGACVTLTAPGVSIRTTNSNGSYSLYSGTSFAAPIVTGVAALVKSQCPTLTPAQIKTVLIKSATDPENDGWSDSTAWGVVNAFHAVAPPAAPGNLYITGGEFDHPTLHWTAPAPDVMTYTVRRTIDGRNDYFNLYGAVTSWTDADISIDPQSPIAVTYRVRAKDYSFQVSPFSNSRSVYTSIVPVGWGEGQQIALFNTAAPEEFEFAPPSPNPFNMSTTIQFGLPKASNVRMDVFDINGRLVTTLVDESMPKGWHAVSWQSDDIASGTYFLLARAGGLSWHQKLTVIK